MALQEYNDSDENPSLVGSMLRYRPRYDEDGYFKAKPPRGGQGVQWPRSPWTLGGPWASKRPLASEGPAEGPWAQEGPIEMTLRNQHVRPEDLYFSFFGDHLISSGKTVRISVKTLFVFWDHLISTGKTIKISVKTFFFGDHLISTGKPFEFRWRPFFFFFFFEITL